MSLWAIIPVKPLRQGKTRLAGVLSEEERYALNLTMLGNTLNVLKQTKLVTQALVVSRDSEVLSISREFGFRTLQEDTPSNLNRAVWMAVGVTVSAMVDRVLILPADLPLLEPRFLEDLASRFKGGKEMIIVPDRREDGTNALLLSPPDELKFQFGPGSFGLHVRQAQKRGFRVEIVNIPELSLDLDLPADLDLLRTSVAKHP